MIRRALALAALLPLFAGCAAAKLEAIRQDLAQTRQEMEQMREREKAQDDRMERLEQAITKEGEEQRAAQAAAAVRHQEVMDGFERLESALSDSRQHVSMLREQIDAGGWTPSAPGMEPEPATESEPGAPGDSSGTASPSPGGAATANIRAVYEAARLDLTQGRYQLAASSFQEFVRLFPDTELSDNAQYWLGECYYAQQKFPQAIEAFRKVVQVYPRGDKVPSALLKIGLSYLATGNETEAVPVLKRVASEYERTPEGERAMERLKSLAAGTKSSP
jgi:tol-pal system protein YbgF